MFFSGVRNTPFAYDPVSSKVQPASEFQKKRAAYEEALLGGVGPTTSPQSLVMGGRNIFFRSVQDSSVYLAKIENIGRGKTPRSPDVSLTCSLFTHSPQLGVSGFFGTFRAAPAGTGKAHVTRDSILVYNVQLCQKSRHVTLASLRQLAISLPEMYPIPQRIPRSHLPKGTEMNGTSSDDDSSDDDEFDFTIRNGVQPRRNSNSKQPALSTEQEEHTSAAVARPRRNAGAGPSARTEPTSAENTSDESEDESEEEEADQDSSEAKESESSDEQVAGNAEPGSSPQGQSFFCPEKNTLVMVNFKGADELKRMKHPAALAFVEDSTNGTVKLRWYGAVNWSQKINWLTSKEGNWLKSTG